MQGLAIKSFKEIFIIQNDILYFICAFWGSVVFAYILKLMLDGLEYIIE